MNTRAYSVIPQPSLPEIFCCPIFVEGCPEVELFHKPMLDASEIRIGCVMRQGIPCLILLEYYETQPD